MTPMPRELTEHEGEVLNRFAYHPATPATGPLHDQIRKHFQALALTLLDLVPAGRHQSLALTALQDAMMWSNAGVAVDTMTEDRARREELQKQWGKPRRYDAATALRALGKQDEVAKQDVVAFLHSGRAAAEAYAASDEENYGHPSWLFDVDGGTVVVLDLRPALAAADARAEDEVARDAT